MADDEQTDFRSKKGSFFNTTKKQLIFQVRQLSYIEDQISEDEGNFVKSIGKENVNKIKRWIAAERSGENVYIKDVNKGLSGLASMMGGGMKKTNALDTAKVPQILIIEKEIEHEIPQPHHDKHQKHGTEPVQPFQLVSVVMTEMIGHPAVVLPDPLPGHKTIHHQ